MPLRVPLVRHPDSASSIESIEVELVRTRQRTLTLRFLAHGPMRTLKLSRWRGGKGERRDELWRTTCFEMFLRAQGEPEYYALAFAPSKDWSAYRFTNYREGMAPARVAVSDTWWEQMYPPEHGVSHSWTEHQDYGRTHGWQSAHVDLGQALDLPIDRPWQLGFSAVIEERNGRKSWWALAHPPGAPDFHHEACFALELPAARPA
ncbi:hypothetical protein FHS95_002059 [Sphingomonas naasensis]|uniref:DOMON-like domain-containing protein n=1 Tax=Sphingomonas naasensis TaxID=1344951 RepID=A0A4S1WMH0_9SPHN|nr:DOMON-like domain-containing protein [Sphingomonas naasensis]NIJ20367.1 hypothetical protein [Sphingomonas naasensis]TGX44479.1 DOMON-like domain-containing protein [Sphingomonas naasensis]